MIVRRLKGMGVALITPFKSDGSVDYNALVRLVEYQVQNGVDFLCVLGTTAETPTLTEEEKRQIKKVVIERVNGRVPILLGISSNCTQTVLNTLKNEDFTGVDAVLVAVPYYNKPSQEGIYQHYKAIAEATDLPVVLYNVPGRTGVNMTAETTLRLARDFKNIVAIKEASGNITQMDDIIKNKPENFDVISGDDGITFPLITLGAVGVISVIGNAFPREFSRMTRLALAGDYNNALTIHHQFTELFKLLFMRDRTEEDSETEDESIDGIIALISRNTGLSNEDARLFHLEMWIFVHGIATMIVTGYLDWEEEYVSRTLTDVYEGLKARWCGGNGK